MCHGANFVRNPSGTGSSHWPDSRVIKIVTFFYKIIDLLKQENRKKKMNELTHQLIMKQTNKLVKTYYNLNENIVAVKKRKKEHLNISQ